MATLNTIAQMAMDLYLRDFKTDEEFLSIEHFDQLTALTYAGILQADYEFQYRMSLQTEGSRYLVLADDWQITEQLPVKIDESDYEKKKYVETTQRILSFVFDKSSLGLQDVRVVKGNKCFDLVKINRNDRWKMSQMPITKKTFYWPENGKVYFDKNGCIPEIVEVTYVPSPYDKNGEINGDMQLPEGKEKQVIEGILNIAIVARSQGAVIDKTNDTNPNTAPFTELNNVFSQIKTKSGG